MLLNVSQLVPVRTVLGWTRKRIIATNGCFDVLHAGHVSYLEQARSKGDFLMVGLNSDASVTKLKGEGRPINTQDNRAAVLLALRCVDGVCVFEGKRCVDFLLACKPHLYVKGGDYTMDTLDPDERAALGDAEVAFIPMVPNLSTSAIIAKI